MTTTLPRRKQHHAISISAHLESFRTAKENGALRDALAEIAMRLCDSYDRQEFAGADGATTLFDHLSRITEEQATLDYMWASSTAIDSTIDEEIGQEFIELGAIHLLLEVYTNLPAAFNDEYRPALICAIRNLSMAIGSNPGIFPIELVTECWRLTTETPTSLSATLAAEVLTNMAARDPKSIQPSQDRIAVLLNIFFAHREDQNVQIAIADVLTNLCFDPALCLLVIYELDERKPRQYRRHSGAVYFLDLADEAGHEALRQSMGALAHNLSWSDPAGKRIIQKLGLSTFMSRFAEYPQVC